MLRRPAHLVRRQTTGRAFGMPATLLRAGMGGRTSDGLWQAGAEITIPLKLAQAPGESMDGGAMSAHETDATRRVEASTFYLNGQPVEPLRTGDARSSADRILWNDSSWRVKSVKPYGDLVAVMTAWEDPQENDPGYVDNPIDLAVRRLVRQASNISGEFVIPGNGPGPSPDTVFATVLRMTDVHQGWPVEQEDSTGGRHVLETRNNRSVQYSVQWYRSGAFDVASRAMNWLGTSLAADAANALGIRIQAYNQLRDMDAVVSSEWEERWGMELEIAYFDDNRWDSSCIDSAPFEVRYE